MSMGTYGSSRSEPLITGGNQLFVDPLLQAIVLTAIVIGFGMTAFLLVLVYRTYKVTKEDEIEGLRGKMMLSNLLIYQCYYHSFVP
ncbi:Na(+) H(+) antiporter subunit C [Staphylococcus aureus]|nr:Na(+) H(+) antiporter subunit C [Staphylococcus aureus]